MKRIEELWKKVYGDNESKKMDDLMKLLDEKKKKNKYFQKDKKWLEKGIIYSLYVDHFSRDLKGLKEKIPYLKDLGVKTIWLLPILESPMQDQGFDISDYYKVRSDLGTNEEFYELIDLIHENGMKIIFDIAVNHTSVEHEYFKKSRSSKVNPYRDWYIWNKDNKKYNSTRILFKGMMDSNWEYDEKTGEYYFHRFYEIQPDLNYKNPDVLIEMINILSFWKLRGIDGFRMDAAPFLWKEEGTNSENLEKTHLILKIFREALDYISEGTTLIAEANQPPKDVVEYFGQGDECHAAYHFPLMPKVYLAIAENKPEYIIQTLSEKNTPKIPDNCQWLVFLRCHDELTLEFVTEEERKKMLNYFLHDKRWSFREGEGISGRLMNLFKGDIRKILLAYSSMFSIRGTFINYYGDEIGMENNDDYYKIMKEITGYSDSRYFNRGPFDWELLEEIKSGKETDKLNLHKKIKEMIKTKNENEELFNQEAQLLIDDGILVSKRYKNGKKLLIYNNFNDKEKIIEDIHLEPYSYEWILKEE
ncbi:alpha-amylase family glycosyl hydrolase [Geotoga petraea]|jgi:maltose alpha-D-glucosyltransferase/alpha-amylase|uniref:Maltose alpha-D-glucosyltransferase/ alpha-amylase n=1 Tax=Geotoga petraea TaxID=28234 RepID=A0A1G6IL40_9BACT|nr:alpha-amylase family glycosyl hydrolase [Geotoga petraea]MDK2945289.1 maltose alpha-D-glucosyltransferase / alpha-amylase [Geotoga sp.]SDC07151.1 maltose alpha-D-glucosyltransferase/ alpha-amylase [Geotoga petraea]